MAGRAAQWRSGYWKGLQAGRSGVRIPLELNFRSFVIREKAGFRDHHFWGGCPPSLLLPHFSVAIYVLHFDRKTAKAEKGGGGKVWLATKTREKEAVGNYYFAAELAPFLAGYVRGR